MSAERQRLAEAFGGTWDGASPEIHGLIDTGTGKLKIELLFSRSRKIWSCSVFKEGACVGQATVEQTGSDDFVEAVQHALQDV